MCRIQLHIVRQKADLIAEAPQVKGAERMRKIIEICKACDKRPRQSCLYYPAARSPRTCVHGLSSHVYERYANTNG